MRCIICDKNEWKNVDQYRLKKEGMSLCQSCGFVSYPEKYKTKEEIIEFYRKDYRPAPTAGNFYTGQRKLHYHAAFLRDEFKRLKKSEQPVDVLEVGSAYGMFLKFVKDNLKDANVTGTELTTTFKRVAKHQYGIDLVDDFSDDARFDLICTYKVAEHMLDIDQEMERYHRCLKDGGRLYIGVPTWFDVMHNFGMSGWDIEYYYSTNHINVWTRKLFESLLKKTGFKIVKQDHEMYDSVYLCEKTEPQPLSKNDFEDVSKIETMLTAIKEANDLFVVGKFVEAVSIWPNFPTAITNAYETNRKKYDSLGFDWLEKNVIQIAREKCLDSPAILAFAADIYSRYDKLDKAIEVANLGLQKQPGAVMFLTCLGQSFYRLAESCKDDKPQQQKLYQQAREYYRCIRSISKQHFNEAVNWEYALDSLIEV